MIEEKALNCYVHFIHMYNGRRDLDSRYVRRNSTFEVPSLIEAALLP